MNQVFSSGMTLRQWYASMALQGIITNEGPVLPIDDFKANYRSAVQRAFSYADAMIAYEETEG
jgi:hypothetical protein